MAQSSIQELQRSQILRMLNLGNSGDQAWGGAQTFKVLVYDKFCQEVIAPLLKVGGLRNQGVSINVGLLTERGPMPDVPAVYFVEPTEENVRRIVQDLSSGLYESVYVNFASSVPRSLLQELAKGALQANCAQKVAGVYDRFISFVSLSPTLFSLNLPEAYATIHSPSIAEQLIGQYIARIVDGLLSVLVSMHALPIIRCPANDPVAEMVARSLEERIREMLRTGGASATELFTGSGGARGVDTGAGTAGQRPLLCILDRNTDLVTMLNHTWTYQAMAHDILGLRLNRLTVPGDEVPAKPKSYDVDENDKFWAEHAGSPFPNVGPAVCAAVQEFDQQRQNMTQSGEAGDPTADMTSGLAAAFNAIPEMTERKRSLDMHTNIATALMNEINVRDLANYYEIEDQFASQSLGTSISQVEALFSESQKGTLLDKTRALMVLYLTKPSITSAQMQGLIDGLQKIGGDTSGISYLQHLANIQNMMTPTLNAGGPGSSGGGGQAAGSGLMNSLFATGEGLLSAGFSSIKNIMPSKKELAICQILEGLMEQKPGGVAETYLYLDPKAAQTAPGTEAPRMRAPFRKAITFVVGGGNYAEMQAVQEWAQAHGRQVTYGSTDLVSPAQFVDELSHLGRAQSGGGTDLR
mmetsp:Transcript_66695/g.168225  ORF Transcript_66695/g.168225 Transcript_66695/m.168225 type:complete len:638 (+) Transcript_66695:135-2048(+)